jgi:type II secretory pathway predicted ATPase ExeA
MMMFKAFWGMEFNPFDKSTSEKNCFKSNDFTQAMGRLEHLRNVKGLGLFTGLSGTGKTFTLRCFASSLNTNLYKTVYIPLSTVTVLEFFRSLAFGLDLEAKNKKIDLFRTIQDRMISLAKDKRITPVIIVDEAQYLKTEVLNDIKLLMNFYMDSKNYAIFILNGQPVLNNTLSKDIHEAIRQRIVINYNFEGISKSELEIYIESRLKLCGVSEPIFEPNSIEAIYACCNGSTRKLNSLIEKCLIIGAQSNERLINSNMVMLAQNEIELVT